MLTILTVNVFLRSKKEKNADAETKQDYFTPKRFLLYARCVSVVLVTLFLIGITGSLCGWWSVWGFQLDCVRSGRNVLYYAACCLSLRLFIRLFGHSKNTLRQGVAVFSYPRHPTCRRHMLYSVRKYTRLVTNTSSENNYAKQSTWNASSMQKKQERLHLWILGCSLSCLIIDYLPVLFSSDSALCSAGWSP